MPSSASQNTSRGGALVAQGIQRRFGPVVAIDDVSIEVRAGEFFSLLGPSGCGKTTLLRILAGLDAPDAGSVSLDGEDLLALPAHERPVNTVFQSYALFPHLTVAENVAFGLRMKKTPAEETRRRTAAIMKLVAIENLAARKPHELSGGQRQRVALARALVNEPRVLLLDEPLAAVDQKLRKQLQSDLRALQRRLGLTFIYVTHDQEEALSLSDRLAVLNQGRVEQIGAPREIYEGPRTRFVAEFLGGGNWIPAQSGANNLIRSLGGGKGTIFFRREKVILGTGRFNGLIEQITFAGLVLHIVLETEGVLIHATALNQETNDWKVGDSIQWDVPTEAVSWFSAD